MVEVLNIQEKELVWLDVQVVVEDYELVQAKVVFKGDCPLVAFPYREIDLGKDRCRVYDEPLFRFRGIVHG